MGREKKSELKELEQIKRLLVLQLIKDGVTATEIGKALGITQQRVSQMFPVSKLKKTKRR